VDRGVIPSSDVVGWFRASNDVMEGRADENYRGNVVNKNCFNRDLLTNRLLDKEKLDDILADE